MAVHKTFDGAFKAMYRKIQSVKSTLPSVLANEGTKFFVSNFALSGFTDVGFSAWKPIKVIKNKKVKANRKILVKTGRLRRAVNNSVIEKTFSRIVWSVNKSEVPYASVHNDGYNGIVKVTSHDRGVYSKNRIKGDFKIKKANGTYKAFDPFKKGTKRILNHSKILNMPRRHFMGKSEFLTKRFKLTIKQAYQKAFN